MSDDSVFETHHDRYEAWFVRHEAAYLSELLALRAFVPWIGNGLEVGVGSGRFAAPLGVRTGIDPSPAMLAHAAARGVEIAQGVAEDLPFSDGIFDYVLIVTTICFVDSPKRMLTEAHRVLRPGGRIIIGFIDRESPIGREYLAHQSASVFYRSARFFSVAEVAQLLRDNGFRGMDWGQTLTRTLAETSEIEPLTAGHGDGAFVVAAAVRTG